MEANAAVPQREHPAVETDQLSAGHAIFYLPPAQAQGHQLSPGNDAVLPLGQLSNCTRRLPTRCNAFSGRWTDKTLHRRVGRGRLSTG